MYAHQSSSPQVRYKLKHGFGKCDDECSEKQLEIEVLWWGRSSNDRTLISTVYGHIHRFAYINKNCDKLYFKNSTQRIDCQTSRSLEEINQCTDCDGDSVEQHYCSGYAYRQCPTTWSEWGEAGACKQEHVSHFCLDVTVQESENEPENASTETVAKL